jgi:tRNA wybutosine-synthesizing protein 3
MQNTFSHLVPDYEDPREDILASFPAIRSKTLETLYGIIGHDDEAAADDDGTTCAATLPTRTRRRDKSPKGSVDEAIQDLVNLINAHPSFATLSSCSGRIALYDPLLARSSSSSSNTAAGQGQEQQQHQERSDSFIEEDNFNNVDTTRSAAATRSGKGGTGGWLLASHEVVEATILIDLLQENNDNHSDGGDVGIDDDSEDNDDDDNHVLSFKMEPLLLHVAAANLTRGRQLLQMALSAAGLRESGLVVTESRVTVALRGYSLALSVPLTRRANKPLRPNNEYLVALVQQANRRLQRNFEKIARLFEAVQSQIFRPINQLSLAALPDASTCCRIRASPLPALNLWRHASVMVPNRYFSRHTLEPDSGADVNEEEMELLVFGGYGSGPIRDGSNNENDVSSTTTRRSDKVYRLHRNLEGSWSTAWEEVVVVSTDSSENALGTNQEMETKEFMNCLGLKVRNVDFTAREGLAACVLSVASSSPLSSSSSSSKKVVIAIFGGRQGPNRPLNDLLFFDKTKNDYNGSTIHQSFQAPIDVRGAPPAARWGHSFTAISSPESIDNINNDRRGDSDGEQRPLALVVGGRNDSQTFASVHVLSIVKASSTDFHLVWTEVMDSAGCSRPRFYHAAAAMASCNQTFVFGGLWNSQNLLDAGSDQQDDIAGLVVNATTAMSSAGSIAPLPCTTPFDNLFGHAVCLLPGGVKSNSCGATYLSIGGIPRVAHDEDEDSDAYLPIRCVTLKTPTAPLPSDSSTTSSYTGKEGKLRLPSPKGSWIVQEHSVEFCDDHDDSGNRSRRRTNGNDDLGCLVHHSCNVTRTSRNNINSNEFQLLVVGGGVQGFAFGPIFGKSHLLTVCLSSSKESGESNNSTTAILDDRALVERRAIAGHHDANKGCNGGGQRDYAGERIKAHAAPNGNNIEQQRETSVLYVTAQDAKTVKTLLEEARLLDKEYRMGPAAGDASSPSMPLIAVPVTADCLDLLENGGRGDPRLAAALHPLLQGSGRQHMSFSSSVFAARRARRKECS